MFLFNLRDTAAANLLVTALLCLGTAARAANTEEKPSSRVPGVVDANSSSTAIASAAPKEKVVEDALRCAREIHEIAVSTSATLSIGTSQASWQAEQKAKELTRQNALTKAARIIDRISDVQTLEKTAMVCITLAWPQDAGDAWYDNVLDSAFWYCAGRIARIKGPEAESSLLSLKRLHGQDAGGSYHLKMLIAEQQALSSGTAVRKGSLTDFLTDAEKEQR